MKMEKHCKQSFARNISASSINPRIQFKDMRICKKENLQNSTLQRTASIELAYSGGSVIGRSGANGRILNNFNNSAFQKMKTWWNTNVQSKNINIKVGFKSRKGPGGKFVTIPIIKNESRSPFQCAEPDALNKLLDKIIESPSTVDLNQDLYFKTGAKEDNAQKCMSPCQVCRQWTRFFKFDATNIKLNNLPIINELKKDKNTLG